MNKQPVSYFQTDPRWKNKSYSAKGESTTIGASGCGPTSMAMVLATWADSRVTPETECAWALKNGYKAPHQGTYYSYFVPAAKRYGIACTQLNSASIYGNSGSGLHAQVKASLDQGDLVIACMGKGNWTSSGHYVLVWGIQGDTIYINDPASSKPARTRGSWALFRSQVKYYWRLRRPSAVPIDTDKKEEDEMSEADIRKIVKEEVASQLGMIQEPVYNTVEDVPAWGRDLVQRLVDEKVIQGSGAGFGITLSMLRMLVFMDRLNHPPDVVPV